MAVAFAAGDFARFDAAALTAPGLDREVLEEKRVHGSFQTDMKFVDLAFGQSDDADVGMAQTFVNGGDVLLITADAIQCLRDDHVEGAALGGGKKRQHARAVAQVATADSVVRKDIADGQSVAFRAFPTNAQLIVDRGL